MESWSRCNNNRKSVPFNSTNNRTPIFRHHILLACWLSIACVSLKMMFYWYLLWITNSIIITYWRTRRNVQRLVHEWPILSRHSIRTIFAEALCHTSQTCCCPIRTRTAFICLFEFWKLSCNYPWLQWDHWIHFDFVNSHQHT